MKHLNMSLVILSTNFFVFLKRAFALRVSFVYFVLISSIVAKTHLEDIQYQVRENGVEIHLSYSNSIDYDNIIAWKSDQRKMYLTLLDVTPQKNKGPYPIFSGPISSIILDDIDGSTQLSFMFKKPILGYEIVNISTEFATIVFIHLAESQEAADAIRKNQPVYSKGGMVNVFPQYNTVSFNAAFERARMDLGPNSFFKFNGKIFLTNISNENDNFLFSGLQSIPDNLELNQLTNDNLIIPEKQIVPIVDDSYLTLNQDYKSKNYIPKWIELEPHVDKSAKINKNEIQDDLPKTNLSKKFQKSLPLKITQNQYKVQNSVSDDFSIENQVGFQSSTDMPAKEVGFIPERIYWFDSEESDSLSNNYSEWLSPQKIKVSPYRKTELTQEELDRGKWYQVQQRFLESVPAGIRVTSNVDGVPIYIDGKRIGKTPLNGSVRVKPGWHQVSGFTPIYAQIIADGGLYELGNDPITRNNQLYGSKTIYVEEGNVMVVNLKFNQMSAVTKNPRQLNGGMLVGFPVIMAIFVLITWGMM